MAWFSLPEGYTCVTRQNDTTLYAYQGSRRDTFTLNGLRWQRTATSGNTSIPSSVVCVTTPQIPSTIQTGVIVGAVLVVLCFLGFIYKIVRRLYL